MSSVCPPKTPAGTVPGRGNSAAAARTPEQNRGALRGMPLAPAPSLRDLYDHSKIQPTGGQLHFYEVIPMRMRISRSASACLVAAAFVFAASGAPKAQS